MDEFNDNVYKNLPDLANDGISDFRTRQLENLANRGPIGSIAQPITRALFGINHRIQPGAVPINKDQHGIALFTRPRLNLTDENIMYDRRLAWLRSSNPASISTYIRCMLDPDLQQKGLVTCPFVDPYQAFIPIFTNTLESLVNWQDIAPGTYEYHPGLYKEARNFIDGPSINYTTYDISASFRNVIGNIITRMTAVWLHYASCVFEGRLVPYPEYWWNFETDYDTRIFKLSLDASKEYVTQVTSTIAFPLSSPTGASSNYEANQPFNESLNQLSIPFRAHGLETYDDILIEEFNMIVEERNPSMKSEDREVYMHELKKDELAYFNNYGYPRIDMRTKRLSWWISKDQYKYHFG